MPMTLKLSKFMGHCSEKERKREGWGRVERGRGEATI